MSYAKGTAVHPDRTRVEIEKVVRRAGATSFASMWSAERAEIAFESKGRRVRFSLSMPSRAKPERRFTHDARGTYRGGTGVTKAIEAEERRLWRALLFVIKAKLESVESGIETFDNAFLANLVVPSEDGVTTVGEYVAPALAAAYARGASMPRLLGAGT